MQSGRTPCRKLLLTFKYTEIAELATGLRLITRWGLVIPCTLRPLRPLLLLLFGIPFHLQLVLLSHHPIFLHPYHFLKLVSFLGANRTKSASVCLWLLRGAI